MLVLATLTAAVFFELAGDSDLGVLLAPRAVIATCTVHNNSCGFARVPVWIAVHAPGSLAIAAVE